MTDTTDWRDVAQRQESALATMAEEKRVLINERDQARIQAAAYKEQAMRGIEATTTMHRLRLALGVKPDAPIAEVEAAVSKLLRHNGQMKEEIDAIHAVVIPVWHLHLAGMTYITPHQAIDRLLEYLQATPEQQRRFAGSAASMKLLSNWRDDVITAVEGYGAAVLACRNNEHDSQCSDGGYCVVEAEKMNRIQELLSYQ